jgi:3-oxoacyl-[acyl-carrier protein] reductase
MFELNDKTALVTGATGGIGGGIARALHKQGATVAISGRQADKLEKLAAELGSRVHICPCDLANKAQVAKLIDEAIAKLGRLDILVNNAGLTKDNLFMVMKDDQWDDVIAVNLTSTFMLMRAATRAMMRTKTGYGRIINISSISGGHRQSGPGQLFGLQGGHHSHVEIAGARGGRARHHGELHRAGLHLHADDGCAQREADLGHQGAHSLPEVRHPDDIAAAAVFLASTEAAYMTGQTLHVNGGLIMI